jgi:hypothetical protein
MNQLTIWDYMQAAHCWEQNNYIEYNQVEPYGRITPFWQEVIECNEMILTNQQTPEHLTVKHDLYEKLCEDSQWLVTTLCKGDIDLKIKKKGVRTFLIKNGWSNKRIKATFDELKKFMADITEV